MTQNIAAGVAFVVALAAASAAHAQSVTAPRPIEQPNAEWPPDHVLEHDMVIPVVLLVDKDGHVEEASVEAGVGEPFDSIAVRTALKWHFEAAHDATGPVSAKIRGVVRFVGVPRAQAPSGSAKPSEHKNAKPHTHLQVHPHAHAEHKQQAPAKVPPPPAADETVVNVRGQRAPRSASATVIERDVLRAAPHRNASELLYVVPGVFVSQHSGEGKAHQIFFRGFDAVHGQDVELWAGGAPVNDVSNIHGQGYADLHFIIPEVVKEIRSTPGTYDPRQGDFAVAGTIEYVLGYGEPGTTAKASIGSFGTRRYFMAYHPKDANDATFGAFELYATDGFGPSRAARHASAMGQATYKLGDGVAARVMASTYAGRFDSAGVLRLDDVESGRVDRFATYDPKQGGYSSRTQLALELGSERDRERGQEGWSISPFVIFRSLKLRSNFTGFLKSPEGDSIQQRNDATTAGALAAYHRPFKLFSDRDAFEAGVYLRSDSIEQSQHRLSLLNDRVTDDEEAPGVDAKVRATDVAGYVDTDLHFLPRLSLRAGLRADGLSYLAEDTGGAAEGQTRSSMGGQLSKRGTLNFGVLPGLNALLSYGEGFRSPQARSLGDGETTPFTRVVSYEAGLRYRDADRFQSSLAVFRTSLSDDLVFDQSTARNELVPGTSRTGVAATLGAQPRKWLVSNTSFTYTRATFDDSGVEFQSGDLLPYVPEFVARSDLAYTPVLGHAFGHRIESHFGTGLTYLGRRPLPFAELGHDVFLLDASAEVRIGPVQAGLEVFNLLGAEWYDGEFIYASQFRGAASLVPVRHVTVGPPRSFLFSIEIFV